MLGYAHGVDNGEDGHERIRTPRGPLDTHPFPLLSCDTRWTSVHISGSIFVHSCCRRRHGYYFVILVFFKSHLFGIQR
jgi:hypothetical protein